MDETQTLDQMIQYAMDRPCILCGKPFANGSGVFVPTDSQSWGALAGKQRYLVYPMCSECQVSPDANERVEGAIALSLGLVEVH